MELYGIVWLPASKARQNVLAIQRLQYSGINIKSYTENAQHAYYVASNVRQFMVCPTTEGNTMVVFRLYTKNPEEVVSLIMKNCFGEIAVQLMPVQVETGKPRAVYLGYREKTGLPSIQSRTLKSNFTFDSNVSLDDIIIDPQGLNVDGVMAAVCASIGSAMIEAAQKEGATANSIAEEGANMIRRAAPKIEEAIKAGIPMAKGTGTAIRDAISKAAEFGEKSVSSISAYWDNMLDKKYKDYLTKSEKQRDLERNLTNAAGAAVTALGVTGISYAATTAMTAAVVSSSTTTAAATPLLTAGIAATTVATTGATAAASASVVPMLGWVAAGAIISGVAVFCICSAVENHIAFPNYVTKDMQNIGAYMSAFISNPYPPSALQLVYLKESEAVKQLASACSRGHAFADSIVEGKRATGALLLRMHCEEMWADDIPGWVFMNTANCTLELSSGEIVPLGIIDSNKALADFIATRIPIYREAKYRKLIEKFAKQF